ISLHEFSGHRREHVVVFVDRLESLAGKFAFHRESNQQFLSHEAQAARLHGGLIAKKLDPDRSSLPDPPRPAAGLTQGVERITGFVKDDGGKFQEIQTGFDQLWMRDYNLNAFLNLASIPGFTFRRIYTRTENGCANSFIVQNSLQSRSDI